MASLVVSGDTSGAITIAAPAVAGTNTLTLPASTGTLVVTGGAQTIEFADGSASAPSITNSGDTNTGMFFPAADTIAFTEGGTESMRIDSNGNVGIGRTASNYSGYKTLAIDGPSIGAEIDLYGGGTYQGYFYTSTDSAGIGTVISTPFIFSTNNSERMRITSGGVLLVGSTTSVGAGVGGIEVKNASGALFTSLDLWNTATSGNNIFETFATEGSYTARGSIDYNRGAGQVRYNTTSDQRLKENIVDSSSALPLINSVKIRAFDWKETGFHVEHGVIAQELETVSPDAVSVGEDNEDGTIKRPWGVDTSTLVPALVKAIQELNAKVDAQAVRIAELEGAK